MPKNSSAICVFAFSMFPQRYALVSSQCSLRFCVLGVLCVFAKFTLEVPAEGAEGGVVESCGLGGVDRREGVAVGRLNRKVANPAAQAPLPPPLAGGLINSGMVEPLGAYV